MSASFENKTTETSLLRTVQNNNPPRGKKRLNFFLKRKSHLNSKVHGLRNKSPSGWSFRNSEQAARVTLKKKKGDTDINECMSTVQS